jgi:hypothetical protein
LTPLRINYAYKYAKDVFPGGHKYFPLQSQAFTTDNECLLALDGDGGADEFCIKNMNETHATVVRGRKNGNIVLSKDVECGIKILVP